MLRYLLTFIRQSVFGHVVPVDESIAFHKLVGHVLMFFSVVHTVMHFLNYTTLDQPFAVSLFQTQAGLTGFLLLLVFGVMWVCALDFIRRGGHFELFYITHFAFVVWFILALLHGPVFWQWATLPILGYALERLIRFKRTHQAMPINEMNPLPSGVTRLELSIPDGYRYRSGDYVFIKVPGVSKYEWHPFTVTTAPEEKGILSVHVRSLGNWTRRLYTLAKGHLNDAPGELGEAYIDGPYGTPSAHIFEPKVAVLVGAGIGVTPFAAILKSIFHRRGKENGGVKLDKVHFVWMNRDQFSFEWFSDMLAGLEAQDPDKSFLDIQVYLTGVKLDMTSALLDVALDVHHTETGKDLFTGLAHRTNLDRPNWSAIFKSLAEEHQGKKVDVYFCGPGGLSKQLSSLAARHGFGYRKENF